MTGSQDGRAPEPGQSGPNELPWANSGCLALTIALAVIGVLMLGVWWYLGQGGGATPSAPPVVVPASPVASAVPRASGSAPASAAPLPSEVAAPTAAAPQRTLPPGASAQPAPTVVAQLAAPRGFVAAPDPAGGVAVQWAQLSLGVDPVSFSVRVDGAEVATVPFEAGVVEYRATLPAACGSIDVTVAAVGTAGEAETAPIHVDAAACP